MVDKILNDKKAWKNDNKDIFTNVKKKSNADWTRP
jgi:hypothetical protein